MSALVFLLAAMLSSTSCNKDDDETDEGNSSCNGYVSASISGAIDATICLDRYVSYINNSNETVTLTVGETNSITYSMFIQARDNFGGTGTFSCGMNEKGYVELDIHGDNSEFYKSTSGTLTITKVDASSFEGKFDVTCKGYNNGKEVKLTGWFKYNK